MCHGASVGSEARLVTRSSGLEETFRDASNARSARTGRTSRATPDTKRRTRELGPDTTRPTRGLGVRDDVLSNNTGLGPLSERTSGLGDRDVTNRWTLADRSRL